MLSIKAFRTIMFCALLIAHTPAKPTFNLELPDTYTTVACFVSCCIGAMIYGIMHYYLCNHTEITLQKLFVPLQEDIKAVQTEQQKVITFILKKHIKNIINLREDMRVVAYQTGISIEQHTKLLNIIDTCFQNNKNTVPMVVAYYWMSKYTKQTKELEKYKPQSNNAELLSITNSNENNNSKDLHE